MSPRQQQIAWLRLDLKAIREAITAPLCQVSAQKKIKLRNEMMARQKKLEEMMR